MAIATDELLARSQALEAKIARVVLRCAELGAEAMRLRKAAAAAQARAEAIRARRSFAGYRRVTGREQG